MGEHMALTYEQAERALQGAMAKARELEANMTFAVVDARGLPVALGRMTGAGALTSDVAAGKARVSAYYGAPSGAIAERMPASIQSSLVAQHGGRLIFWQGAVPIRDGDELVGAIGGSGSTSENDEVAAQAGVDAI